MSESEGTEGITEQSKPKRALYEPYVPKELTHEQIVEKRLGWIVGGVWVVAIGVIASFIASIVIGAAAAAPSIY